MASAPPDRRAIVTEALRKIDDLSARLAIAEQGDTEPIAVVGMGCRLPGGADSPAQYWELLRNGGSGVVGMPKNRWDADEYFSAEQPVPGTISTREGGFLTTWQPDEFDAEFFGMSPREATGMDPQQRLLMEVTWEALENAGITAQQIRGTKTAVFVGLTTVDYVALGYERKGGPEDVDPYVTFGNASNFAAGRLSYFLGVQGPAVVVDTACSSSLVTIHLACQSLRRRESDQALTAGVNLNLIPDNFIACSQWGMLAPDGLCKTFDAGADGYVRSEGCGVVVLKRLSDAERDGDQILAVIRGSAVNQDGPSSGQTVPSGPAQQAVMRAALAASRLTPSDIDYVEAHGTGTQLGDPIELDALSAVFGARESSAPLVLGSVKTNIGHLESAAGVAGFIKTVLSVRHGVIPKHLHFTALTPHAGAGASKFTIASEELAWPAVDRVRRAGVSSFGVSGTNAHIVIEQAPEAAPFETGPETGPEPVVHTLVLSGKTAERISASAGKLAEWLTGPGASAALADVAHTLNHHRTRHKTVAAVCARDRAQTIAGLQALAAGQAAPGVVDPHVKPGAGTVFVYSGQGSHWTGMARQLLAEEPVFAAAVDELEPVFVEQVGYSLKQILANGEEISGDAQVQPVIMGVQLALTTLLRSYGVQPDAVMGHSMGEVTAAVVSGALSVADGLKVIAHRSKLMSKLAGQGAVALLGLDADATEALFPEFAGVSIAGYLSPRQTVVAGPVDAVDAIIAAVAAQDEFARRVNMEVASHTAFMEPILDELRSALAGLVAAPPTIPFISTVTEDASAPALDAEYWVANVRRPARVTQAVTAAAEDYATFLEISPHPLLTYAIGDTLEAASLREGVTVTAAMKRVDDETLFLHTQLVGLGATLSAGGRFVEVPTAPWQHDASYWIEDHSTLRRLSDPQHPLLGAHVELVSGREQVWQTTLDTSALPWLTEHRVQGLPVVSTAAFAEMALAAGCAALGLSADAVAVSDLDVEEPLAADSQTRITTQLAQSDNSFHVEIHAKSGSGDWRRHAVATVAPAPSEPAVDPAESAAWVQTEIGLPAHLVGQSQYRIHPVLLDSALQTLAAAITADSSNEAPYFPAAVATLRVFGAVGSRARCRTELADPVADEDGRLGRIVLTDDAGTVTAELTGVELRQVDPAAVQLPLDQKIFQSTWLESPLPIAGSDETSAVAAGSWLVLTDSDAETQALAAEFGARLSAPTRRVISAPLADEAAVREAVTNAAADPKLPAAGVVVFVGKNPLDDTDPDGALGRARELILSLSTAARAAVDGWEGKAARLWVITRDGLVVTDGEPGDPTIGALKGVVRNWRFPSEAARFLADEPDLGTTLVDLDGSVDRGALVAAVLGELGSPVRDDVVARRGELRYAERLARAALDTGDHHAVVRADGSYVITGGLGGLGLVVARWLIGNGAGRLVLNGRRSELSEAQQQDLAELAAGAEVVYVAGDIASSDVADQLVAAAEQTGRPLRGVVHAAGVAADGIVAAVTADSLQEVWAPKVTGALRLHVATATKELDWWVGFSSMAALLGLPGQLAYATSNAWLDALVAWRRASGLPGTAIGWGQWSDVGMAKSLTYSVSDPIAPAEGVEALQTLVGGNLARVGVTRMRLDRAVAANPEFRDLGYFEQLVAEFDASGTGSSAAADDHSQSAADVRDWPTVPAEERRAGLALGLQGILAGELRMPTSAVDVDKPFPELGLDSMMAMTILKKAQQLAGIDLSASMLWNHPTITQLAAHLADLLEPLEVAGSADDGGADEELDAAGGGVLDELFDSVESSGF